MTHLIHEIQRDAYFNVIVERMSEVRNGTFRNTKNENKRPNIFRFFSNMILHMNSDYVIRKKQKAK